MASARFSTKCGQGTQCVIHNDRCTALGLAHCQIGATTSRYRNCYEVVAVTGIDYRDE
jgi:hypothetical protein